jgi:hypothetical protein
VPESEYNQEIGMFQVLILEPKWTLLFW